MSYPLFLEFNMSLKSGFKRQKKIKQIFAFTKT